MSRLSRFARPDSTLFDCPEECDRMAEMLTTCAAEAGRQAAEYDRWGLSIEMEEARARAVEHRLASLSFHARSAELRSMARNFSDSL